MHRQERSVAWDWASYACTRKRGRQAGFSLVEVLVGITILAISVGSIFTAMTFASRVAQHNVAETIALNLAIERMDQVKNSGYGNITAANFPTEAGLTVGTHPVSFNRSVTIATTSYKTVTVRVTWTHLGWPFQEIEELSTIISSST